MKPKLHVRFCSRAGMATFRLRQRHQEFDVLWYSLAASLANTRQTAVTPGWERERDDKAESDLSSEMPNSGEPDAVKVARPVRKGE